MVTLLKNSSIIGWKSTEKSLSASSNTIVSILFNWAICLWHRSSILPGVPTRIWIGLYNLKISSWNEVPPVDTIHYKSVICFPKSLITDETFIL